MSQIRIAFHTFHVYFNALDNQISTPYFLYTRLLTFLNEKLHLFVKMILFKKYSKSTFYVYNTIQGSLLRMRPKFLSSPCVKGITLCTTALKICLSGALKCYFLEKNCFSSN